MPSTRSPPSNKGTVLLKNAIKALFLTLLLLSLPWTHHTNHYNLPLLTLPSGIPLFSPRHISTTIKWAQFPGRRDLQSMMNSLSTTLLTTKYKFRVSNPELAWEKGELAYSSLGYTTSNDSVNGGINENVWDKWMDGLGDFLRGKNTVKRTTPNIRKKRHESLIHRRLKSSMDHEQINNATYDDKQSLLSAMWTYHPLTAAILIFIGMISIIIASFVSNSSDSRRLHRIARLYNQEERQVLDEEEAEILEFYDKEMEERLFCRMLSFDVEDDVVEQGEQEMITQELSHGGRTCEEGQPLHLRDDSYYTRVLDGENSDSGTVIDECKEKETAEKNQCHGDNGAVGEISRSVNEESSEDPQSQDESLSSSISSLTTPDDCEHDVEASNSFSTIDSEQDFSKGDAYDSKASPKSAQHLRNETRSSVTEIELMYRENMDSIDVTSTPQLKRQVTFNPQVTVQEIPSRQMNHHVSSEKYILLMLATVGILIAIISFFPAHPSLSPIASVSRKEVLRRADSILNSQWDVEL